MPKKEYRHTDYAIRAKKRARRKVQRIAFELNVPQTERLKHLDLEKHDTQSVHTLAKKLFLQFLDDND